MEALSKKQAVFLQLCFPVPSAHSDIVLKELGISAFFSAIKEGEYPSFLTQKEIANIKKASRTRVEEILNRVEEEGQEILPFGNPNYPEALIHLSPSPICLYYRGNLGLLSKDRLAICVVGSRRVSDYGLVASGNLSYQLAKAGVVVVSGFARGADSAAHAGAIVAKGDTIAISACGLNLPYPQKNAKLARSIESAGLRLSEYPPDTPAKPFHFPLRNRLLAGLSAGVFLIEGGNQSGAMITALEGLEQGKDVFVLPNSIYDQNAKGNLRLLKEGAKPVSSVEDILEEYPSVLPTGRVHFEEVPRLTLEFLSPLRDHLPKTWQERKETEERKQAKQAKQERIKKKQPQEVHPPTWEQTTPVVLQKDELVALGIGPEGILIYETLSDQPISFQELGEKLNLSAGVLFSAITSLELLGLIRSLPGRQYVK